MRIYSTTVSLRCPHHDHMKTGPIGLPIAIFLGSRAVVVKAVPKACCGNMCHSKPRATRLGGGGHLSFLAGLPTYAHRCAMAHAGGSRETLNPEKRHFQAQKRRLWRVLYCKS